MLHLQK